MFENLLNRLRRRKNGKVSRRVPRRAVPVRPLLEALEARWCPANLALKWVGGAAGNPADWDTAANWRQIGGGAGEVPVSSDTVTLFGTANDPVVSSTTAQCESLSLDATFATTHILKVLSGGVLNVGSTISGGGGSLTWNQSGATLQVDGKLGLIGGGTSTISAGVVRGGGEVDVGDSASTSLTLSGSLSEWHPTLNIGYLTNESSAFGAVTFQGGGLSGNVTLYDNAVIRVGGSGTLTFSPGSNADTRGGLRTDLSGSGSEIIAVGNVFFNPSSDGTALGINVLLDVRGGTTTLKDNAQVRFDVGSWWAYSVLVDGGALALRNGSHLKGNKGVRIADGIMLGDTIADATGITVYIDMDVTMDGAGARVQLSNQYGDMTHYYATWNVAGNFTQSSGTIEVNVDGSHNGVCSKIVLTNNIAVFTIGGIGGGIPKLVVQTDAAQPSGFSYTIFSYYGKAGSDYFGGEFSTSGGHDPAGGWTHNFGAMAYTLAC